MQILMSIKKIFHSYAYAVGIRQISSQDDILNFSQKPFTMLMPTDKEWYADSFCFADQGKNYLFMEIMGRNSGLGTLGVAEYDPFANTFSDVVEILKENFHLSYPNVFKFNDDYYMIPETNGARQIRLYKAEAFPYKWKLEKVLLDDGRRYMDTSYFEVADNRFILFSHDMTERVSSESDEGSVLKCFSLDLDSMELQSIDWVHDAANDRPGGNVLTINGKNYRVLQDCSKIYGEKLKLYEITKINVE